MNTFHPFTKPLCAFLLFFFVSIGTSAQTEYVVKYDNGQVQIQGFLKDSALVGKYSEYYEDGQVETTGQFKNCEYNKQLANQLVNFYYQGNSSTIRKGKKHGEWIRYFKNGNILSRDNYFCGIPQGSSWDYHLNGNISMIRTYSGSELVATQKFYENGALKSIEQPVHVRTERDEIEVKNFFEAHFYENGALKTQGMHFASKNDSETAVLKEYHANGFLKTDVRFDDINSEKSGFFREFREDGKIIIAASFEDGTQKEKRYFYNQEDQLSKIETWINEKLAETQKHVYNEKGELTKIETWEKDNLIQTILKHPKKQ